MSDGLPVSLRERHKQRRRAQILDAARALLRERRAESIAIEQIAERAEVAPATIYNLRAAPGALGRAARRPVRRARCAVAPGRRR